MLGTITWRTTHSLDPRVPIASEEKPVVIEAIAMDWKWLFVYPEQGIATINEISFPANVPVEFKITSDTVMNSFFIPQLGSQIYAMAGMQNKLHLIANEEGEYNGISANYSGHGFSNMKFMAHATSKEKFAEWVNKVKASSDSLQWADFVTLEKPTDNHPVQYFGSVKAGLYQDIINKFMDPAMNHEQMSEGGKPVEHEMNHEMTHDMAHDMPMSTTTASGE